MTIEILSPAERDLDRAAGYYADIDPELAERFLVEFEGIVSKIRIQPEAYRLRPHGFRRVNFKVFPYYVAYILRSQKIVIVAVAASELPDNWLDRLFD